MERPWRFFGVVFREISGKKQKNFLDGFLKQTIGEICRKHPWEIFETTHARISNRIAQKTLEEILEISGWNFRLNPEDIPVKCYWTLDWTSLEDFLKKKIL